MDCGRTCVISRAHVIPGIANKHLADCPLHMERVGPFLSWFSCSHQRCPFALGNAELVGGESSKKGSLRSARAASALFTTLWEKRL